MTQRLGDEYTTPIGIETKINTSLKAANPDIVSLGNGGYMVFYEEVTTSADNIKARIFNADGQPAGAELLVNTTTTGFQSTVKAASLTNGGG